MTDAPEPQYKFVGFYLDHKIRIAQHGDRWKIHFDPVASFFDVPIPWEDNTSYLTVEAAKDAAVVLAQKKVHDQMRDPRPLEPKIKWRPL